MKIIVDENIPFAREAFGTLGQVISMPGRDITKANLADARILCVRSVTKVDARLLEGAAVKFVGSATIGTDHLDMEYLDRSEIHYCSAPGCNADSVADYVTASLLYLAGKRRSRLEGKIIGVVGCGNVGSRVVKRAGAMGMTVLENDPPLARQTGDKRYLPLEELFAADYISFHVPLTLKGPDATYHIVNSDFLKRMGSQAILFNTSRGPVADSGALKSALLRGLIGGAVLDVWENEPYVDMELMDLASLATPHIAGYSLDGKINGTAMIYNQICRWLDIEPSWNARLQLPETDHPCIDLDAAGRQDEDVLRDAVFTVYPIEKDDSAMRDLRDLPGEARARAFDMLRKNYPGRREFSLTTVRLQNASTRLTARLRGVSFQLGADVEWRSR